MIDVLGEALRAASMRSAAAYPLLVVAGGAGAIGPCSAPRALALVALTHGAARPGRAIAAFAAGVVAAYVVIASAAGAVASLWGTSRVAYAALAAALAAAGVATLVRARGTGCAHAPEPLRAVSVGGTFLAGAASALVVSPCCTPAVALLAALTMTSGRALDGTALVAAFACGHALPLAAVALAGDRVAGVLRRTAAVQAPAIVAGTILLALGAFYGVLA
jgi:cytochrome c biogenesis protein CcdA